VTRIIITTSVSHDGLDEAVKNMRDGLDDSMKRLANRIFEISQDLLADGSTDTGALLKSGYWRKMDHAWYRVGYTAPWGPYVEYGTRAHFPPPKALLPWCRRHLRGARGKSRRALGRRPVKGVSSGRYARKGARMVSKAMSSTVYGKAMSAIRKGRRVVRAAKRMRRRKARGPGRARGEKMSKKDREAWNFAWAVAMSIKKRGTEPKPFLRPAVQIGQSELVKIVKQRLAEQRTRGVTG